MPLKSIVDESVNGDDLPTHPSMARVDFARKLASAAWERRCAARVQLDQTPCDFGNADPYLDALSTYKEAVSQYDALSAFAAGAVAMWHLQNGTPIAWLLPRGGS